MTDDFIKWRFVRIDSDVWHRYIVFKVSYQSIGFVLHKISTPLCTISLN
ncbi:hypothetical protein GO755_39040 [Spirosoma sp. HMF4905]|uniref:Uncharacterized protein n=1 Tax=Spirosoma arboris TaxID=2682092 RepID=A0A7K1SQJ0_9BACT|nr:hypothetical protein [Spirosoma arboris]MVM36075.1 hypothetical protein [Spirosoma arboris]